ncbi:site-specific integrase [Actinocorallia sp. A-T 12471]|uniref:site-specific integrase n=1 Tax=Actinocorallia sp. A-T 12471 TaxID=3089813 RepID=UPI0029CF17BC|nr:site-specific integrase [Actinocorallia sp. A-T 12471]MDX6745026.1 site-specific integrase [Actinocorallia sp. A-T 12471]
MPDTALDAAVRAYLGHLAAERGLAANTLSSYRRDLRRYAEHLTASGVADLGSVAESDVLGFAAALRAGAHGRRPLGEGSAVRAVVAVRGLHAFAHRAGLAAADPARDVRLPAPAAAPPEAIPPESVARLLAATADPSPLGLRDRALVELLYDTGLHISEAVGLDLPDLLPPRTEHPAPVVDGLPAEDRELVADRVPVADRSGGGDAVGAVRVRGGRVKVVSVGARAARALAAYLADGRPELAASDAGAVFVNARGGRLSRQGAWLVLGAAARRADLGGVSPRALRRAHTAHAADPAPDKPDRPGKHDRPDRPDRHDKHGETRAGTRVG